jgi:hypothetical protein
MAPEWHTLWSPRKVTKKIWNEKSNRPLAKSSAQQPSSFGGNKLKINEKYGNRIIPLLEK